MSRLEKLFGSWEICIHIRVEIMRIILIHYESLRLLCKGDAISANEAQPTPSL
jgi:hypothetical protein